MSFSFGIYPGGAVGGDRGIVEPVLADDPALITRALDELHGSRPGFLVRAYLHFRPPAGSGERLVPAEPERLLGTGTGTGQAPPAASNSSSASATRPATSKVGSPSSAKPSTPTPTA